MLFPPETKLTYIMFVYGCFFFICRAHKSFFPVIDGYQHAALCIMANADVVSYCGFKLICPAVCISQAVVQNIRILSILYHSLANTCDNYLSVLKLLKAQGHFYKC